MNDQSNFYDAVIADLRSKREQIDHLIQTLELFRNWVPPAPGMVTEPSILGSGLGSGGGNQIAAGAFHGMSIEAATKKLLQMRKRMLSAQEIASDIQAGGLHLQSDTPANTVTSVLTRAFNGGSDVVRVKRGMWGLQEWYPNQRFKRGED